MAQSTFDAVQQFIAANLGKCYDDIDGSCLVNPPQSTGIIVYNDDRLSCSNSWILVPGFNLLPRAALINIFVSAIEVRLVRQLSKGGWNRESLGTHAGMAGGIYIGVMISMKKKVKETNPVTGEVEVVEKPVWNWVVANLSLMALGTSAPEIVLATVETISTLGQKPGELGPACIVGSAAYNFFIITAVCTVSLAYGQTKRIEQLHVFVCTFIWSVFAYFWMYIVYEVVSPHEIEIWEAFVTLAFFPILVCMAWLIDTQPWRKTNQVMVIPVNSNLSELDQPQSPMASHKEKKHHSILHYRMMAMRQMAGETKIPEMMEMSGNSGLEALLKGDDNLRLLSMKIDVQNKEAHIPMGAMKVGFASLHYSVLESQGRAKVVVRRYDGDVTKKCTVNYRTQDNTAIAGIDYEAVEGVISFLPGESEREISINIIDDDMAEPDVTLLVMLSDATGENVHIVQSSVPITIVDDDDGGVLSFELPTYEVARDQTHVTVPVVRRHGVSGSVTVDYSTKDGSALAGSHYQPVNGTLTMPKGEARASVRVPILKHDKYTGEGINAFKVVLSNPMGGVVLGARTECRILITPISNKATAAARIKSGNGSIVVKSDAGDGDDKPFELWSAWAAQFKEAIIPDIGGGEGAGMWVQLALHYVSITWKLILALIPPPEWKSGFPTFGGAIAFLVFQLLVLQEAVELFGCQVGLTNLMTGMTIVAIGTSLPDTFASRMAALQDDGADAAIGNITGSNSVNVFLGLGFPWVIASLYYKAKGEKYLVEPGALGFSVVVYACLCVFALLIVVINRWLGGELGGSKKRQWFTAGIMIALWLLFVILSGLLDYGHFTSAI